jgi:dimethylargininase
MTTTHTRAIVRGVADTLDGCIRPPGSVDPIDIPLARRQHAAYVEALSRLGLEVHSIAADDRYPDCCFVEDPAVIAGDAALVCRSAAPARRGEEVEVERALARFMRTERMAAPATMDGGDVMRVGKTLYVGLTERTNPEAALQLETIAGPAGFRVTTLRVRGVLHLKSACTPLDEDTVLVDPSKVDARAFAGCEVVEVPREEGYAANCLSVNGTVLVSEGGFARTRDLVAAWGAHRGFEVVGLEMSEFRKAGGSLTCLSLLL